ncbi:MAG: hypothetical protein Kow0075_03310 [Salibacteraceae bacterium]
MTRLTVLLVLIATAGLRAQNSGFQVDPMQVEIRIGEQADLNMTLRTEARDTGILPLLHDTLTREIEIVKVSKPDTTFEGQNLETRVVRQTLTITAFDTGYFAVKPLEARVNDSTVLSNPILITVHTVKVDTAQSIYDIRGVQPVSLTLWDWIREYGLWIAGLLLLAALVTGLIFYFKKRPAREAPVAAIPKRPPHEVALERLESLKAYKPDNPDEIKHYYSELTDILREYLEERFFIPALEQTSDEIIASMKRNREIPPDHRLTLGNLLYTADLVKFAKEKPLISEMERHLTLVERFVRDTVPQMQNDGPTDTEVNEQKHG